MRELRKIVEEWIDNKYDEIRATGRILHEIDRMVSGASCEEQVLAAYVKYKLLKKAKEKDNVSMLHAPKPPKLHDTDIRVFEILLQICVSMITSILITAWYLLQQ